MKQGKPSPQERALRDRAAAPWDVANLEVLNRDIQRILGSALPQAHLTQLIGLAPVTAQTLSRFFQTRTKTQLKKGQADHLAHVINEARGLARHRRSEPTAPASFVSTAPTRSFNLDPDLPALATPEGSTLARALKEILQEGKMVPTRRALGAEVQGLKPKARSPKPEARSPKPASIPASAWRSSPAAGWTCPRRSGRSWRRGTASRPDSP